MEGACERGNNSQTRQVLLSTRNSRAKFALVAVYIQQGIARAMAHHIHEIAFLLWAIEEDEGHHHQLESTYVYIHIENYISKQEELRILSVMNNRSPCDGGTQQRLQFPASSRRVMTTTTTTTLTSQQDCRPCCIIPNKTKLLFYLSKSSIIRMQTTAPRSQKGKTTTSSSLLKLVITNRGKTTTFSL